MPGEVSCHPLIDVQEPEPGIAILTMTHDAKRNALSAKCSAR